MILLSRGINRYGFHSVANDNIYFVENYSVPICVIRGKSVDSNKPINSLRVD